MSKTPIAAWKRDEQEERIAFLEVELAAATAEVERLKRRLDWATNELLSCDYGDNERGLVGWIVFGWRDVKGIHSVIPPRLVRRIYGKTISDAIDAEFDVGGRTEV